MTECPYCHRLIRRPTYFDRYHGDNCRHKNPPAMNGNIVNLAGQVFGHLVVIDYAGSTKTGASLWVARCDCGTVKSYIGNNLIRGGTRSCGHDRRPGGYERKPRVSGRTSRK